MVRYMYIPTGNCPLIENDMFFNAATSVLGKYTHDNVQYDTVICGAKAAGITYNPHIMMLFDLYCITYEY